MAVPFNIAIAEVRARLADSVEPWMQPLAIGSMRAVLYAPQPHDDQKPHTQDELYIVTNGEAVLEKENAHALLTKGDLAFVEAGKAHHFEQMSQDFECWAIFWGRPGGEGAF